ncbi:MAG: SsrA-binding protein SmpB [Candidatus Taylorbacteria bacterium]|nr:SsrA-binding protein SmpB [Candidatus Taylorbacteria bacterium]
MSNFAENRKAYFNYEIIEKITAGIELLGIEVKAIKAGQMSLDGSYVIIRGGEAFLIGSNITPLQPKNIPVGYDPRRNRKLLLTKKELKKLAGIESKKGLTILALSVYNIKGLIKVLIGIGKGKKKFDKRENIKEKDLDREARRNMKG